MNMSKRAVRVLAVCTLVLAATVRGAAAGGQPASDTRLNHVGVYSEGDLAAGTPTVKPDTGRYSGHVTSLDRHLEFGRKIRSALRD